MILGHFAVGLAAKKYSPNLSLVTLFVACQLLDFIWPIATFLGLESVAINHSLPTYNALELISAPYSHSLGMTLIWSAFFGTAIKFIFQSNRSGIVAALVVCSHWILDFITHIPDLPLWFGELKFGLGLWTSAWATFLLETTMFIVGIYLYLKSSTALTKKRKWTLFSLLAFLLIFYTIQVFGPQLPETNSSREVAGPAFAMWLVIIWAYFADKKLLPNTSK